MTPLLNPVLSANPTWTRAADMTSEFRLEEEETICSEPVFWAFTLWAGISACTWALARIRVVSGRVTLCISEIPTVRLMNE